MVQPQQHKLSILNETPRTFEGPELLHKLVPQVSTVSAIDFLEHGIKRRKFSYQQLHTLSDILAQRIIELTATLENASAVVPVLLPQCPELYIVLLAILKAGKAFCPLNLDTPDERLKFILSDISADLLITNTTLLDRLQSKHEVRTICADRELLNGDELNATALPHIDSTDLAYVLYTSGSTGLPKAVSVSHRAVTQSLLAHDSHIPGFARFLQFAAPTFDVSIFEIFFPWFRGKTLVGCLRERMLEDLPGIIETLAVDAAELTPTVVGNLLQGRSSVPGLKLLLTIGEMLTQHVVTEFGSSASRAGILWAMYGPTEAAIHCTLQARFETSSSTGNIGYPLDTVSTFVVAPAESALGKTNVTILPWGEEGELALGGYQIAEEYLNRPELTDAVFVNHPVYGRLYRTGDRARFRDDGLIECLGRIVTGQVKLRGQRVELGEIEQVILKVEGCRVVVAAIVDDTLVAFCATTSGKVSSTEVLRMCKQWLPAFMIPSDVLILPSMPQLPSGKIDKRSLEAAYSESLQHHGTDDSLDLQPDDHAALAILRLSQDCLGRRLSLDSDLGAAGLDSLRAIRIASRLRKEGYNISAVEVLASPTLYDLIRSCKATSLLIEPSGSTENSSDDDLTSTSPKSASENLNIDFISPCTPLQEAMLVETMSRPSAYCNWIELELTVTRTHDEIVAAISQLAKDNSILRSGFRPSIHGTGSFEQITWKELEMTQIKNVSRFEKAYTLSSTKDLLRPFAVSIQDGPKQQHILVQIHHAMYDGWSFDLILTDLDKLLRGWGPTKRPQFSDVSRYYTQRRGTSASEEDTRYWAHLLHDYTPTTLVNYNGETRTEAGLRSYRKRSVIDIERLSAKARCLAVNPQVFFQAAIGYILGLYTGSTDVVFGNVTSGRTLPVTGVEDIVGPCIASLPCRLDFGTFSKAHEALEEVQRLNREGLRHCTLPLRDIARAAKVQPGTKLFDVLFVWQQSSTSGNTSSLAAKIVDSADDLEFKLTLEFEPCDSFISFRAMFDPSILPEKQVISLSQQIDEVVGKLLDDTSCTIADIGRSFTTSSLSIANPDYQHSCDSDSLSHAVETWAKTSPEKEAVIFGHVLDGVMSVKETATYSGLNTRANQLARLFSEHGVAEDHLVCIMMEKCVDLYVSILAVSKLGAGYLPLVPDTPAERLSTILRDAKVTLCVSDSLTLPSLRKAFQGIIVNPGSIDFSTYSKENIDTPYHGKHIAYAVFTSGSTGVPKGVLVTQQNLMSNLKFLSGLYPASPESRMLQSCSQAFDVSVFEIFYAWYVGMSLCTAMKEDLFRDFEASINNLGVTHLSLTPTVAALVNPNNVPKVEFLVTAGEALTEHVRRRWAGRGLYQGYGPSETTNICTVRPSVTSKDLINNIGPPFDNTSAFVLDPSSKTILPRGAVGELCFGGEQVFRGYLNRPELNDAKLIDIAPYGRIYRSGDMGRLLPDDCILSAGRLDDQVKIRGQRVELGEITSIVLDDIDVADCVTLLFSTENGAKSLVTFWVHKKCTSELFAVTDAGKTSSTISRIFGSLSRQLPTYMIPTYLIGITKIPMTAQAKVDKRLLQETFNNVKDSGPEQFTSTQTINGNTVADIDDAADPLSDWEKSVAEHLARILDIDLKGIRRESSLFNLGLDSVSAIRFCWSLRKSDVADFTVAEVLKNPSISYLDAKRRERTAASNLKCSSSEKLLNVFTEQQRYSIRSVFENTGLEVEKINPCTPLQEAMLASSASFEAAYSNTMIFDVKGDLPRLQASWKLALVRHEMLRTSFVPSDHPDFAYAQVVLKHWDLQWDQLDNFQEVQLRADAIVQGLVASHRPPLYLAVHITELTTKLIFSCHHALYDGIAITNLLGEIQKTYFDHELPPAVSYDRYLQHLVFEDVAETNEFWLNHFLNFEPTYFPDLTGMAQKITGTFRSTKRDLKIPLSALRSASRQVSVSVLPMVQAAWVKLLHYYTGEYDLCFGNIVSGRAIPEEGLDALVAPCFNALPVRAKLDFSKPNAELVQHLHNFNVDTFPYQLTALRRIQNAVLGDGCRLFDTLVVLQQPSKPLDETIWSLEEDMGEMDLPVVCEVYQDEQGDCLRLTLHYKTDLLSDEDAQIVAQTFDSSLWDLAHHPDAAANDPIDIPHTLRAISNPSLERLPTRSDLLHKAFEQNASSLPPDAIALDFLHSDDRRTRWSYQTLDMLANRVAYRLMRHGVGVEDVVPIHMLKSPMFYASIVGVLKAGAAFAPVHPDLPEARKDVMFKDLNPKVVLCTEHVPSLGDPAFAIILNLTDLEDSSYDDCEISKIDNLRGSNLAYCLYTSGSTGVPKAVSVDHQAPVQTIESSRALVPWTQSSRLLQYAAITFDMCYYDCFLAWTLGFTLCSAEQHIMFDNLPHVINSHNATLLDLTPSVAASLSRLDVPGVQWLYCIGEAMSDDVAAEWGGACVNSYGPTEAAFCTTMFPISKDTKTSIIGQPYPSTSFAVFSLQGQQPLPLLSTGELYIGGAQLARGYYGRSELTNDRFVTRCGQRFYKSGDVVRKLSNGNFEFIGRADDQVKIRGLRVELGEINQVLQHSDLRINSVVTQILKKDTDAKEQLVSFLAMGRELEPTEESEFRRNAMQAAKHKLPGYMVPQIYVFVSSIPRSMASKVDKKALSDIFKAATAVKRLSNEMVVNHTWTDVEMLIRDVLSRLSRAPADEILPELSIYQLGLDSISAVQIASALRKQGYEASASDVLKYPTCIDLAEHVRTRSHAIRLRNEPFDFQAFERKHRPGILGSCGFDDQLIEAIRPCTPLQQGMLSQYIAQDGLVYYNYIRLKMRDANMDVTRLKDAWRKTMTRHPILRTGFAQVKDEQYSFAMVQHMPDSCILPWSENSDTDPQLAAERLGQLQRESLTQLHQPMWDLRIITHDGELFLDLSMLHALFDAHSLQLIFEDVVATYCDQPLREISLPESTLSELLQLTNKQSEQTQEFWSHLGKQTVSSRFPNMTPLRLEPAHPVVLTRLSSMSVLEMEHACRAKDVTLQAASIASWSTILSAYTAEPTVTVGIVLSGRTSDMANNAVLPCINTVPFPCTVTDDKMATMKSVMKLNAELYQHQFTPLNKIQKLMGLANESLFDSLFAFQKPTGGSQQSKLWTVDEEKATTEYPISIEFVLSQEVLQYRLTYLPHIIPSQQANMILEQLDHVMRAYIIDKPETAAGSFFDQSIYSITPAKESTLPSEVKLLHQFVESTADVCPDRVAFEFASSIHDDQVTSKRWSYRELDAEGNRIASLLLARNVQQGGLVGVCFEKCPEASFAMLGILKAGCAFVAIDPSAPGARQTFMVEDSGAQVVLTMSSQSSGFTKHVKVPVINLDRISTHNLSSSRPPLERPIVPQDRSYCLYTSGTTGTPKGCELTHENAVQALLAFQRLFAGHWDSNSRWLQFASFHFDVSVLEQYWSWSAGICVVSAPRDLIFEDLANSIRTLNITHIDLTPSLAQTLHPDDVPSLCKGVFITGGESLKQEILDVWGPTSVIYNGYGPTEATIGCTMYPRVPANGKPSNIGHQFDNVGSYVLKPGTDIPVLRGGVGELCVSGKLVGKGYLNRPDLTEQRFAHLDRFKERVYRTGDLVRVLYDGTFDFLGRADDQVKLRGQRLEIGEINSVIRQSSKHFTDVATIVLKHPKQQKEQLVAFVVIGMKSLREPKVLLGETVNLGGAKDACHDKLPPYMVPTHFVPLASMPLNINNKADGKQLRQIYEALSTSDLQKLSVTSTTLDETWSKEEERLRVALAEALYVSEDAIHKTSSFYELGMDSISVIGVSRAVKQAGFTQVTAAVLMRHATISRLAKALSASGANTSNRGSLLAAQQAINAVQHRCRRSVAESLGVESQDLEALAPCTPLQQGMIARYLDSEDGLYFNTFKFNLKDDIDIPRLYWAWNSVFMDTQILRTAFINTDNGHVQAVLQNVSLPWVEHDAKYASTPEYLLRLRQCWLEANRIELIRPFEIHLLGTKLLLVHIFHGLYDGNSIELLLEEVHRIYCGTTAKILNVPTFHEALPHGPLCIPEDTRNFWEEHLKDHVSDTLPSLTIERTRGTVVVTRELEPVPGYDITRRKLNVTAQAIAQACWIQTLQEYACVPITTGIVVSGRSLELAHANRIAGPLFNTIPYQHHTQVGDTWASAITRAHDFNMAALPHQHTPLRDIAKWSKRSPTRPLFDTLFVYQVAQTDRNRWRNNTIWELLDDDTVADYPLAIEIEQKSSDRFSLTLVTQGHISSTKTSNELLDRFEEALTCALTDSSMVLETAIHPRLSTSNGTAEPNITNGDCDAAKFDWDDNAIAIREQVAILAGIESFQINESTSIFELGLDSIDAIKLSSRLKKHGLSLPVSGIMRGLTINKMVSNILTSQNNDTNSQIEAGFAHRKREIRRYVESCAIDMTNIDDVLPSTPLQEAMVAEMVASDYTRYYNFDVAELAADTDVIRLSNAWHTVIKSAPILRTAFVEVDHPEIDGAFVQAIVKQDSVQSPVNIQHMNTAQQPDFPTIFEELRRAAVQSKTLDPPVKVILLEAPQHKYQILSIAHALYDGWSLSLLHDSINAAYHGGFLHPPSYETTLADILAGSGSGSEAATFWKNNLANLKPSLMPRRRISSTAIDKVHRNEMASAMKLNDITDFAKSHRVSLQTLGQTIFAITLALYTGLLDVTFGCVLSGRDDDEKSQLLFPTMNTVAIRTVLHGSRSELLQYVQENFTGVKQWQNFPLRKASAFAGAQGKLFDSLFIYQKSIEQPSSAEKELYHSIDSKSDVEYPVCVEMEVVDDRLVWRCAIKEEIMGPDEVQVLIGRLDQVLHNIFQSPEAPTIESIPQGISVCGLPAFEETSANTKESGATNKQPSSANAPSLQTLRQIRKALASVAQIPEDDIEQGMSIFHIGLDSISAIKVSSILRKQGIALSVGQMLKAGTVEMMAETADERAPTVGDHNEPTVVVSRTLRGLDLADIMSRASVDSSQVDSILPLTAGQLYMLSMWLNTKGANFFPEFVYELESLVDFEALKHSWQELMASNPILRTRIVRTNQSDIPYVQVVLKETSASLTEITVDKEHTVTSIMQQPWVYLFALRTASGWSLRLKIHHALYDGVSLPLLMQQFQDLCNGVVSCTSSCTLDKIIAVAHNTSAPPQRRSFWTQYLGSISPHHNIKVEVRPISKTEIYRPSFLETSGLESKARQRGVSMQALFLAVYAKVYAMNSVLAQRGEDVVIGIYLANRSLPVYGLSTAAILTVNLLPLRIQTPLSTPLINVAVQIQQDLQTIGEPAHATTSLFEISEWTGIKLDTFVNFLSLPDAETESARPTVGVKITPKSSWQDAVSRVTPVDHGDWQVPQDLVNERVNAAYLHAIDVEATIRDGKLDVGVFAPTEMMSLEDGEKLIENLRSELVGLGQD
ncbi:hypothetical protein C7974DRAFT_51796 [Boeremia exigua]|uniref:uncharacterized protein n=1 Tax=Boeremia exigua TaxID=749465 RepID=UPI001E8DE63A|nr:uncharacterized protein C7974DRAFT_51796 [Boeremia exigua]KAH6616759.1 hypothetical protein C7974DRAFT_51796 [Boeremia exigua]